MALKGVRHIHPDALRWLGIARLYEPLLALTAWSVLVQLVAFVMIGAPVFGLLAFASAALLPIEVAVIRHARERATEYGLRI